MLLVNECRLLEPQVVMPVKFDLAPAQWNENLSIENERKVTGLALSSPLSR